MFKNDIKNLIEKKIKEGDTDGTCFHSDHALPTTRREFLASGLTKFSATMIAPSLISVLASSNAAAEDCPAVDGGAEPMPAFVTIGLSGGASMMNDVIPQNAAGQFLGSYNRMGLGNKNATTGAAVQAFNNVPFSGISNTAGMLAGIKVGATAATLAKTSCMAVCTVSKDDSDSNKIDISGMVYEAGVAGAKLPRMGQRNTLTGTRSAFAKVRPPVPLIVRNYSDIVGSVQATGALAQLSGGQQAKMIETIGKMSETQARRVASMSGGKELSHLVKCGHERNIDIVAQGGGGIDPRQNAAIASIWGNMAGAPNGDARVIQGSMVFNALNGNAGSVSLEMGGYDYHGRSRADANGRDRNAGVVIGRTLQTAAQMNKKVFIYVLSDGSVSVNTSDTPGASYRSDFGPHGVFLVFAYDPAGRPAMNGSQIGHFTNNQVVDQGHFIGANAEVAASAVFANYLKFAGRMDLLNDVIPSMFNQQQLNQIIKFG